MNPARFLCLWLLFAATANAQIVTRRNLADFLGFESTGRADASPIGWGISAPGVAYSDSQTVHSGSLSGRIERKATSSGPSSTINLTIPLDFTGTTIRWRGYLKTEDVTGFAALVLQQIGTTSILATASTQNLNVNGTRDWTEYSISLPVNPQARQLTMSVQLAGTGKVWADDLQLTVDNLPVEKAVPLVPTILDTDHEFDQGSGIQLTSLTDIQVKNLATLAKVWGFVKYHHPAVTTGARHWDYDLFRILPTVVNSTSRTAANTAIAGWIGDLGTVADCAPCATLETSDLYMGPDNDWIADESQLGAELSQTLQRIHRNRKSMTRQFYISVAAGAVSPTFDNELGYRDIVFPDSGFQLLALFRYWNLVRYFHPDRDVMTADPAEATAYWDAALEDSIRGIALAPDSITYQQELLKFIAKVNDTHANLWSSLATRPPIGACQLPVDIRFIEDQAFVWRYNSLTLGPAASCNRAM